MVQSKNVEYLCCYAETKRHVREKELIAGLKLDRQHTEMNVNDYEYTKRKDGKNNCQWPRVQEAKK